MKINLKKLITNAKLPERAKTGDAGYDLFSIEDVKLKPFERRIIRTGIAIEIPKGYYGRIAPRSGLAIKKGIDVMAGVIDSGYRNEIGVVLINLNVIEWLTSWFKSFVPSTYSSLFGSEGTFDIREHDAIAQIIIEKCEDAEWTEVTELSSSERNMGGFGSSDKK